MQAIKSPIYQTNQIREFEALAQERFGISEDVMMQRAGKAAFDFLNRRWPSAQKLAIFCGGGNNGGDGYVIAQLAHERGMKVTVWAVGNQDKLPPAAANAKAACQKAQIKIKTFDEHADLEHPELIIDAICGIGLHANLRHETAQAVEKIQRLSVPILAIDVPTGIDSDTGSLQGIAIRASATITFIGLKIGLLTGSGIAYTGDLALNELQFPLELFHYVEPIADRIFLNTYATYLKPRPRDWHKGLSGHVLVIGGAPGFSGAPRMSAEAALRVGAGLVSIATVPENAWFMNIGRPEIMCHGVRLVAECAELSNKADVIVMGPGMGQSEWAYDIMQFVLQKHKDTPLVLDADALNMLARKPQQRDNWVLTPHPGEAARLLDCPVSSIQEDRLAAIKALNNKYGGVSVLKGAGTLVYAINTLPAVCDKGNPGMATAGMGDILTGVIAGLISQGLPLGDATKLGVCLHAMAGDMAAKDGERGTVATDLMPFLRRLSNLS